MRARHVTEAPRTISLTPLDFLQKAGATALLRDEETEAARG